MDTFGKEYHFHLRMLTESISQSVFDQILNAPCSGVLVCLTENV